MNRRVRICHCFIMDYSNTNPQKQLDLSVIVPLYNEEDSVALLYKKIVQAIQPLELDYEILFVDDGSVDNTIPEASKIANLDTRLRVIKFRRNYGQTPAMAAGIDHARGKYLITICNGTACHVRGSQLLLDQAVNQLGIKPGEVTDDGLFSIEHVNCLGACALGPIASENGTMGHHMTPAKFRKFIDTILHKEKEEVKNASAQH